MRYHESFHRSSYSLLSLRHCVTSCESQQSLMSRNWAQLTQAMQFAYSRNSHHMAGRTNVPRRPGLRENWYTYLPSASLNFWEVLKFLLFHLLHLVGECKEHGVVGGFQPIFCQLCLLAKPQQTNNCRLWTPPQRRQNYNNNNKSLTQQMKNCGLRCPTGIFTFLWCTTVPLRTKDIFSSSIFT